MIRILSQAVLYLMLFSGGLALSWWLQQDPTNAAAIRRLLPSRPAPHEAPTAPAVASEAVSAHDPTGSSSPQPTAAGTLLTELPVPVRDRQSLSAEEIFRFGETYRNQQETLKAQQEQLRRERHRIQLLYDDIRGAQREMDGRQAQLDDALAQAQTLLETIQRQRTQMQEKQREAEQKLQEVISQQTELGRDEMDNLKKMATWFQQMDPARAADILVQYSNEGKIETAIKLLSYIEERNVAKILSAMDDPNLSFQLTEKYLTLKKPATQEITR